MFSCKLAILGVSAIIAKILTLIVEFDYVC